MWLMVETQLGFGIICGFIIGICLMIFTGMVMAGLCKDSPANLPESTCLKCGKTDNTKNGYCSSCRDEHRIWLTPCKVCEEWKNTEDVFAGICCTCRQKMEQHQAIPTGEGKAK